jgi:hypothetical protein
VPCRAVGAQQKAAENQLEFNWEILEHSSCCVAAAFQQGSVRLKHSCERASRPLREKKKKKRTRPPAFSALLLLPALSSARAGASQAEVQSAERIRTLVILVYFSLFPDVLRIGHGAHCERRGENFALPSYNE